MKSFGMGAWKSLTSLHPLKISSSNEISTSSGASTMTNTVRGTFKPVVPGTVTNRRHIPCHIARPEYAQTGVPFKAPPQIALFHGEDLRKVNMHHFCSFY